MSKTLTNEQTKTLSGALRARKTLLAELIQNQLSISSNSAHVKLAGIVHDTKDESWVSALREVDDAVVELHVREIQDIEGAEGRIAKDVFGQCTDCGSDIGFPRLTAYPTAKRCIGCQQVHEEKGKFH